MVALPQQYNTADLPDSGGVTLIPEGQYQAVIVNSELKTTSSGNGQFLALTVVITQGEYKETEFIERLNIINPSTQAQEIAYKTLARISEALGMTQTPADSAELHNKPLMIGVKTQKGKPWKDRDGIEREGSDKSEIKKYLPIPAVGTAPAAPVAAAPNVAQPPAAAPAANPFQAPPAAAVNNEDDEIPF
jgi:hypothetical protein